MRDSLVVSGLFVRSGRVGGIEFMLYGLLEGLTAVQGRTVLLYRDSESLALPPGLVEARRKGTLDLHPVRVRGNRFIADALVALPYARKTGAMGILFPNYFTPPMVGGVPTVTTIADQQYLHFPQFFSPAKRAWLRVTHALTLATATRVVAISEVVRQDILNVHGARHEDRVVTIHVPVSFARFERQDHDSRHPNAGRPFVLSVASHYSHKNLATLLRAFALLASRIPHDLVLVGQRRQAILGVRHQGTDLAALIVELGLTERVRLTGHLDDLSVGDHYLHADAFVFPSLFEGFGMPTVEALGFGVPVITTRCGSLPEVTHGLAQYVDDPLSEEELAERLLTVLASPKAFAPSPESIRWLRDRYSPQRIAREYLGHFNV
jgi:glycosyltransferase involved in cell wall biosynthesis